MRDEYFYDWLYRFDRKRAPLSKAAVVLTPGGETAAPAPSPAARVSPGSLQPVVTPPPCDGAGRGLFHSETDND